MAHLRLLILTLAGPVVFAAARAMSAAPLSGARPGSSMPLVGVASKRVVRHLVDGLCGHLVQEVLDHIVRGVDVTLLVDGALFVLVHISLIVTINTSLLYVVISLTTLVLSELLVLILNVVPIVFLSQFHVRLRVCKWSGSVLWRS